MNVQIEESWKARLQPEFEKDYFRTLTEFVRQEYAHGPVYPPGKLIFNAFNNQTRAVIYVFIQKLCPPQTLIPIVERI